MYCTKYVTARNKLKNNIQLINIPFVLNVLLYGDEGESYETNSIVFQQVQLFIKERGCYCLLVVCRLGNLAHEMKKFEDLHDVI
jgi:hypothetical protein